MFLFKADEEASTGFSLFNGKNKFIKKLGILI